MLQNCHKEHATKQKYPKKTNCSFGISAILVTPALFPISRHRKPQKIPQKNQKKYPQKTGPFRLGPVSADTTCTLKPVVPSYYFSDAVPKPSAGSDMHAIRLQNRP